MRKHLRRIEYTKTGRFVGHEVRHQMKSGLSLEKALRAVLLDERAGWVTRSEAGNVLAIAGSGGFVDDLIAQFFSQADKVTLWDTALTLEQFRDRSAIRPLITALADANLYRRECAARALGWMG